MRGRWPGYTTGCTRSRHRLLRQFGSGGQVLHLDLHPGNVMLTDDGPFVIDWSNGCAGEAGQTWRWPT